MKGRRIIPLAATAALAVGATLAVAPAAHADWEGTITGKILNADGTPAQNVGVTAKPVDDSNPATSETSYYGRTDRNGVYRIDIAHNRTYTITSSNPYNDCGEQAPAPTTPPQATGTVGAVTAGPTVTLAAPPAAGAPVAPPTGYAAVLTVAGAPASQTYAMLFNTATGESGDDNSNLYGDRGTCVYDSATDTEIFHPFSDGRTYFGEYDASTPPTTPLVPAGTYKVEVFGPNGQIFSGSKANLRDATPVAVGTKTDLGTLTVPGDRAPGSVTGHVTVPRVGGFDEWYANVHIVDAQGSPAYSYVSVDAAGNFSVDLAPGTYYASADGGADQVTNFASVVAGTNNGSTPATTSRWLAGYTTATTWFGGKTFALAKKIVVTSNGTVSGVNFNLSNTLQPINKPIIKGKFKQGKKISVTTGDWNQTNDVTFSYVWKEGSKVVGTSASLKLSKKVWKKAKKLVVVVTAYDKDGNLNTGAVSLKVAKTIKAQIKAAKKQLKKDTKIDNKAIKHASSV